MYHSKNQKEFIKKRKKEKRIILLTQISIIAIIILGWELLTYFEIINSFIYSSPSKIMLTIKDLAITGNLLSHIITTLSEVLIAFTLGIILGFIISVIFYEYPLIAKIFDPFLTVLNSLPKVALGPIIIIIAGANTKSIIIMALLINLIVSITTIYNGFLNTDKTKIKMFTTFKASKTQILSKLVIPNSYTTIISSLKLNIALTLIGVITGEFLVSKKGIGYLIIYGTQVFNLDLVMSGILLLLIISYILYKLVITLEKKLLHH
ncbi:MAG: ABC transporter permease subunit [Bacilli bacterium]|nr:ABC transporter permease subunit [Bacilli bacterium]